MSTLIKYRVHEVAKDFKMNSKDISQILTDYATTPKNHMQVLEDDELDIIFEYLTQHNQVNDLAEIFADAAPKKKAESAKPAHSEAAGKSVAGGKPAEPSKPAERKPEKPHQPRQMPESASLTRAAAL